MPEWAEENILLTGGEKSSLGSQNQAQLAEEDDNYTSLCMPYFPLLLEIP